MKYHSVWMCMLNAATTLAFAVAYESSVCVLSTIVSTLCACWCYVIIRDSDRRPPQPLSSLT